MEDAVRSGAAIAPTEWRQLRAFHDLEEQTFNQGDFMPGPTGSEPLYAVPRGSGEDLLSRCLKEMSRLCGDMITWLPATYPSEGIAEFLRRPRLLPGCIQTKGGVPLLDFQAMVHGVDGQEGLSRKSSRE